MATATTSIAYGIQADPNMDRAFQAFADKALSVLKSPLTSIAAACINAGGGAIAATLFTSITPIGGALYGLTDAATGFALDWLGDKLGNSSGWQDSTLFKVAHFILPKILGIGAGIGAVALTGVALTPGTVVALVAGTAAFGTLLALPVAGVVLGIAAYEGYQAYNNPPMESSATQV